MSGVEKPAVSAAAVRVMLIVGGLTVAVVTKLVDVLSDNPEIGWRGLAFATAGAVATYAMKFRSDFSVKEIEEKFPTEVRDSLLGLSPAPSQTTTGDPAGTP